MAQLWLAWEALGLTDIPEPQKPVESKEAAFPKAGGEAKAPDAKGKPKGNNGDEAVELDDPSKAHKARGEPKLDAKAGVADREQEAIAADAKGKPKAKNGAETVELDDPSKAHRGRGEAKFDPKAGLADKEHEARRWRGAELSTAPLGSAATREDVGANADADGDGATQPNDILAQFKKRWRERLTTPKKAAVQEQPPAAPLERDPAPRPAGNVDEGRQASQNDGNDAALAGTGSRAADRDDDDRLGYGTSSTGGTSGQRGLGSAATADPEAVDGDAGIARKGQRDLDTRRERTADRQRVDDNVERCNSRMDRDEPKSWKRGVDDRDAARDGRRLDYVDAGYRGGGRGGKRYRDDDDDSRDARGPRYVGRNSWQSRYRDDYQDDRREPRAASDWGRRGRRFRSQDDYDDDYDDDSRDPRSARGGGQSAGRYRYRDCYYDEDSRDGRAARDVGSNFRRSRRGGADGCSRDGLPRRGGRAADDSRDCDDRARCFQTGRQADGGFRRGLAEQVPKRAKRRARTADPSPFQRGRS